MVNLGELKELYEKLIRNNGINYKEAHKRAVIVRSCIVILENGYKSISEAIKEIKEWLEEFG